MKYEKYKNILLKFNIQYNPKSPEFKSGSYIYTETTNRKAL